MVIIKKKLVKIQILVVLLNGLHLKLDFGKLYINYLLLQYINKADIESKSKSKSKSK